MNYPLAPGSPESSALAKFALLMANVRQVENFSCLNVMYLLENPRFLKDCEQYFFVADDGKIGVVEQGLLEWVKACQNDPTQIDLLMPGLVDTEILARINQITEIWNNGVCGQVPTFVEEDIPFEEAVANAQAYLTLENVRDWLKQYL